MRIGRLDTGATIGVHRWSARYAAMIKTKSIYKPKERRDGRRILVTRFYPRGVKKTHFDRWVKDLAPSAELLGKYKSNSVTWKQFVARFKRELRNGDASFQTIESLHSESTDLNITLLCYEPDGVPCHRHLLREIIGDPSLLSADFVPEYADYHERRPMPRHVAH